MTQTNEESIHQHDAHAEREARAATLRAELEDDSTADSGGPSEE